MPCVERDGTSLLSWRIGPLLAGTLGVAFANAPCTVAQEKPGQSHPDARNEVVVSAARQSDEAITARVSQALQDHPYIFSDHVTVTTEGGVVRLVGRVDDVHDLLGILRVAYRIAGHAHARVINEIELDPVDADHD